MFRLRPASLAMTLAIVVASVGGTTLAGHITSQVQSYTGCLTNGSIVQVAVGDAPMKPCKGGQVQVHFSGGDITAITAGIGLVGGGANGGVALAVAPSFQLPQNCTTQQVAKWNGTGWACAADDSTAYTAGTGLELSGSELSVDPDYRLPQDCQRGEAVARVPGLSAVLDAWGCSRFAFASETCPTGQFASGIDPQGELICSAPGAAAGLQPHSVRQSGEVSLPSGVNFPEGTSLVTLGLSAGTWLLHAKGSITAAGDPGGNGFLKCQLNRAGGSDLDVAVVDHPDDGAFHGHSIALMAIVETTGEDFGVSCYAGSGTDGVGARDFALIAIKVG